MTWEGPDRRSGEEFEEILKRLNNIEIQCGIIATEVRLNHKAFRESESEMKRFNDRIEDTLYGNGHPGLKTKVEALKHVEADIDSLKRSRWIFAGGAAVLCWIANLFIR